MIHINNFLDKLKVAESKYDRNLVMSIKEAKDLHTDITKLLLAIQEMAPNQQEVTKVEIKGNDW